MSDVQPFRRLGIVEAAGYLGFSVTSMRRLMAKHEIAFIDPPRGPKVFDTRELDLFLAAYRVPRANEITSRPVGVVDFVAVATRKVKERRQGRGAR